MEMSVEPQGPAALMAVFVQYSVIHKGDACSMADEGSSNFRMICAKGKPHMLAALLLERHE